MTEASGLVGSLASAVSCSAPGCGIVEKLAVLLGNRKR